MRARQETSGCGLSIVKRNRAPSAWLAKSPSFLGAMRTESSALPVPVKATSVRSEVW